jgi:hypothetical protein
MVIAERIKLTKMGLPQFYIENAIRQATMPYQIRMLKKDLTLKIKLKTQPQMGSGSDATTYGNSDHNIDNGYYAVEQSGSNRTLSDLSLDLGFVLKTRVHRNICQGTFLKGWWQRTANSYFWLPLPSAVLKLGKVMDLPTKIAKDKDQQRAMKLCLYALASSPGVIPLEYPILGPFIGKMLELGLASKLEINHRYKHMKVPKITEPLIVSEILTNINYRYGITPEEIEDFTLQLQNIHTLPIMFTHVIFEKLIYDYA